MQVLREWFFKNKRDLPWRETDDPYAVWISEVMLQQTQVSVVIPYFHKWMETFPTVEDLAQAPIETVLKIWEGLGYYSRARNLHAAAKQIVAKFGGVLPKSVEQLRTISGFGPYTAGAVASFAYKQAAPAVDGNVLRVMARLLAYEEEISRSSSRKFIEDAVGALLPDRAPWEVMEALIELGALVCKKKPQCHICPLKLDCKAHKRGIEHDLPMKKPRVKTIKLFRDVACIFWEEQVLVRRGAEGQVMQDLWEFPYTEKDEKLDFGLDLECVRELSKISHTFTRYRAHLFPTVWRCQTKREIPGFTWISLAQLTTLPFSSGHKRILQELLS